MHNYSCMLYAERFMLRVLGDCALDVFSGECLVSLVALEPAGWIGALVTPVGFDEKGDEEDRVSYISYST